MQCSIRKALTCFSGKCLQVRQKNLFDYSFKLSNFEIQEFLKDLRKEAWNKNYKVTSQRQLLKINSCTVHVGTTDIKPVSEVRI